MRFDTKEPPELNDVSPWILEDYRRVLLAMLSR